MTSYDYNKSCDYDVTPVDQLELEEILESFNKEEETEEQAFRLVVYVINELKNKNGYQPTEDEICSRMGELITGHIIRCMVNKDVLDVLIDESGEESFKLTELGHAIRQELVK